MSKANIEPLFRQMEKITSEYHRAMNDAATALARSDDPDIEGIIERLEHERAALVMARNGVLGEASGLAWDLFRDRYVTSESDKRYAQLPDGFDFRSELRAEKGEQAVMIYDFADAICGFFRGTPYMEESNTMA